MNLAAFYEKAKELAYNIAFGAGVIITPDEEKAYADKYLKDNGLEHPSEEKMMWIIAEDFAG